MRRPWPTGGRGAVAPKEKKYIMKNANEALFKNNVM